jgi:hypothetical protein
MKTTKIAENFPPGKLKNWFLSKILLLANFTLVSKGIWQRFFL